MLRKAAVVTVIATAGLFAAVSPAMAAPYDPATVNVFDVGAPGGDYQVTGAGFGTDVADDSVTLTVTYGTPSGLRSSAGLLAATRAETYTAAVDDDGNFSHVIYVTRDGDFLVTAVGSPSGETTTARIAFGDGSTPTTTAGGGSWSGSSGAGGSGWSDSSSSGSAGGLASTGASIAGPLVIGVGVLALGLGLLLFGTRGVIRRRVSKSTVAN